MRHYSTDTAQANLRVRAEVQALWRDYIPAQAMKHDFLMHGLLALAALHLAYCKPDAKVRYLRLCDKHQAVAVKRFRAILSSDLDPEMADVLFALASIMTSLSLGRSCVHNEVGMIDMDAMTEQFFLTRGIRDIIMALYTHITEGPMAHIFMHTPWIDDPSIELPPVVVNYFESIRVMLRDYGLDPEAQEHCENALSELEKIYRNIKHFAVAENIDVAQVMRWLVAVDTGYCRLVQVKIQPALVILAFFAAAFTAARLSWNNRNFPEYILRGIALELDDGMQHWLEWPRKQLEERMSLFGARPADEEPPWPGPILGY